MSQWFSPICDIVLAKLIYWHINYERGEVEATCKFHDPVQGIIDKPTRYIHSFSWHPTEFEHLVRLLKIGCTNKPLIEEVESIQKIILPKGRMQAGGFKLIRLAFYQEHIKEMIQSLTKVKDGKDESKPTVADQIKTGKLF